MTLRMVTNRHIARALLILLAGLALGACGGGDDKPAPTITSSVTAEAFIAAATSTAASPAANDPTTSATLGANEVLAGQIADRIAAGWPSVTSYRAVTTILPLSGTPAATPIVEQSGFAERVVVLPDTKSIIIRDQGATTEIVLSNGVISKRTTEPNGTPTAWETVDPVTVADNDPFSATYAAMLAPEKPPYSGLDTRQRARVGMDMGTVTIEGRSCTEYDFPEVTETGETLQIRIYLDDADLPCRIETTAADTISRTDYTFNSVTAIATPLP